MVVFDKIKEIIKSKKVTIKELSENISMGEKGLHNALNGGTLRVKVLLEIADYLNVDPSVFFHGNKYPDNEEMNILGDKESTYQVKNNADDELNHLKEKVEHLEKLIEAKNEIIDLMKQK